MKQEKFVQVTGTEYIIHVVWGEDPDSPDYCTYGFATKQEQEAFLAGIEACSGWADDVVMAGLASDQTLLPEFKQLVQEVRPNLFREPIPSDIWPGEATY